MTLRICLFVALLAGSPLQTLFAQPLLRINEFMASNVNTISDPDFGETGDWIELHNAGATAIDLQGYYLTDDLSNPTKWQVATAIQIPAGGYMIFWADDSNSGVHTNFKLSSGGEEIGLFDPSGQPIDSIIFEAQRSDISFGRLLNGPAVWRYLDNPTPGAANDDGGALGIAQAPSFSVQGGFYGGTQSVVLSALAPLAQIRYTTDGSTPTATSTLYSTPIPVSSTSVVRAAAFEADYVPSPIVTHTYFINESTDLPVVSLTTDPANFFDDEIGIYVEGTQGVDGWCADGPRNWNQDWERPVNFEFYETDGSNVINQGAGVRIFGGCSRLFDQKSLAIFARNRYGKGNFDHKFFAEKDIDRFESLTLRNSGQDWFRTMYRDAFVQTIIRQGMDVGYQAYRPAVVFLNGEYWGIHNIREKQNEAYIEDNFGYDREEFDLLEANAVPLNGSADHYNNLIDFASTQDMSQDANLNTVNGWMDVDQFIDYQVAEIFIANADWPSGNLRFWRPKTQDGRWRWMIFDTDLAFGGNPGGRNFVNTLEQATAENGPDWPNPPWSTLLFRSLLENQNFEDRFVQRMASHINTTFDSTRVLFVIDSLKANIASEVPRHELRWEESIGFQTPWDIHIDRMREFARLRAANVQQHFVDYFRLAGMHQLRIENDHPERGSVYVADVKTSGAVFEGNYFPGVPLEVKAIPLPGFRFAGWQGASTTTEDSISINLTAEATLIAQFEPGTPTNTEDAGPVLSYRLSQNYPNPFSQSTTIAYTLAEPSEVALRVFDATGREIRQLVHTQQLAGEHSLQFDAAGLASGTYFFELRAGNFVDRRPMIVVR